jgi:hypothetical protein
MLLTLLIILAAAALLFWLSRPAESSPESPRILLHERGQAPVPTQAVPRILWSYWIGTHRPLVVQRCLANWTRHCRDWEIRLLGPENLARYVDTAELPPSFGQLTPERQSDWLRLYLLQRHGGVWIDASMILTRSMDWIIDAQRQSHAQYLGFYLQRYTQRPEAPIVDSWCMAAPPDSPFVCAWYRELGEALAIGDQAYLARLEDGGRLARLRQGIRDPAYLIIHMCGQVVLEREPDYRLQLWLAEDTAYFFQSRSRWRRLRLYRRLLLHPQPARTTPLIKLRGGERKKLEPYLRYRLYRRSSLVGRQLMDDAAPQRDAGPQ